MRLRTFLITGALLIVSAALLVFSSQSASIFKEGAERIARSQSDQLATIVRGALESRLSILRNFNRVIRADNDLASAFVLSQENHDERIVRAKLDRIRKNGGFDVARILPNGTRGEGLGFVEEKNARSIVFASPLELYGSKVGILELGYDIDGPLKKELEDLIQGKLQFASVSPQRPSAVLQSPASSVFLKLNGAQALEIAITPREPVAPGLEDRVRSRMHILGFSIVFLIGVLIYLFLEFGFVRKFRSLATQANTLADRVDHGEVVDVATSKTWVAETAALGHALRRLATNIRGYQRKIQEKAEAESELRRQAALSGMARQVAHDIRSPLAALQALLSDLVSLPEGYRRPVCDAVTRIGDVADNLLASYRGLPVPVTSRSFPADAGIAPVDAKPSAEILGRLIGPVIAEKRVQYRDWAGVQIEFHTDSAAQGLISYVHPAHLKRVISNLIDNGVEALSGPGQVEVKVSESATGVVSICVSDTGRGIEPETLARLGRAGVSVGKTLGNGLGLAHAQACAERWGGRLTLQSALGKGTSVSLNLPKTSADSGCSSDQPGAPEKVSLAEYTR